MKLREIAHSRTGDKGNTSNISVIAYDAKHYPLLRDQVTADRANRLAQIQEQQTQLAALAAQVATQQQTLNAEGERNRVNEERIAIAENEFGAARGSSGVTRQVVGFAKESRLIRETSSRSMDFRPECCLSRSMSKSVHAAGRSLQ